MRPLYIYIYDMLPERKMVHANELYVTLVVVSGAMEVNILSYE